MSEQQKTKNMSLYENLLRASQFVFKCLDSLFNKVFSSSYNPLYRSGSVAAYLLLIASLTGFYLLFFYRVGRPYESVHSIQDQIFLGEWIRSLHRYSADASVAAVVLHALRMFSQKKSYGPRLLAWVSGFALVSIIFLSAWTGYILVWDSYAQALAIGGAKIFDSLGIFIDPVSRAFSGEYDVPPASFFFMNLFLHIVLPLSIVFGLWLHTAKMARAAWLPSKTMMIGIGVSLLAVAILLPAPMGDKANLLSVVRSYVPDWYFSFWLPYVDDHALAVFALHVLGILLLVSFPFWLRPKEKIAAAYNDPNRCQGCSQCVQDCPYEAISMVDRTTGTGSPQIALVQPELCVSCGICAASCEPFTMGPDDRRAGDQLQEARTFLAQKAKEQIQTKERYLILACQGQVYSLKKIQEISKKKDVMDVYPIDCAGSLHFSVIEFLANRYAKVILAVCPASNCRNKDANELFQKRLKGVIEPTFTKAFDRSKVMFIEVGDGEEGKILQTINEEQSTESQPARKAIAIVAGIFLLLGVAALGRIPYKSTSDQAGLLRLSWRLSGQYIKDCSQNTAAQQGFRHMQVAEVCTNKAVDYHLSLRVDGKVYHEEVVRPGGLRSDRPHYVNRDIHLQPGEYDIDLKFESHDSPDLVRLSIQDKIVVDKNQIHLVYFDELESKLKIKTRKPADEAK